MSTEAVSALRQRMIEDMNSRKLCAGTQRGHIRSCKRFAAFLKRSPDTATLEDIRLFQLHLSEAGVSICNRNRIMTGLRFLFGVALRRLDLAAEIYYIREPQKIPLVMSPDETRRLLGVANILKVRILLSLAYGCGLRAGEVVRLKVKYRQRAEDHSHRAVQGQPRPAEGDVGHRVLPHGGARRPCRALRRLRPHGHCLQQLPQPALPEVSGRRRDGMARRAGGRPASGCVLPCGVHAAGGHCGHRLSEQGRDLRHPVYSLGRDHDRHRGRSQAPGRLPSPRCFTPGDSR